MECYPWVDYYWNQYFGGLEMQSTTMQEWDHPNYYEKDQYRLKGKVFPLNPVWKLERSCWSWDQGAPGVSD